MAEAQPPTRPINQVFANTGSSINEANVNCACVWTRNNPNPTMRATQTSESVNRDAFDEMNECPCAVFTSSLPLKTKIY